jgi:hypothetical protein
MMSKSLALAVVAGMALAGAAYAGDEAPPAGGEARPSASCSFSPDSHELKIRNTSAKAVLGSGKSVQVSYKYADGSVRNHTFRMSSDVAPRGEVTFPVPFERAPGASCSAKIQ